MKKLGFAVILIAVLAFAGCAGGGRVPADVAPPFVFDLSLMEAVRNTEPLRHRWDDVMLFLPEIDEDLTRFSRVTIRAAMFDADGNEMDGWERAIVTLVHDASDWIHEEHAGTLHEPPSMRRDGHPNHILKEFNVDNYGNAGEVSRPRGVRVRINQNPQAILFQNADPSVAFIELRALVFHNNTAADVLP